MTDRSSAGTHGVVSRTSPPPVTVAHCATIQPKATAGTSARTRNACRPHHRTSTGASDGGHEVEEQKEKHGSPGVEGGSGTTDVGRDDGRR